MGYCVSMDMYVSIAKENIAEALSIINELHSNENLLNIAGQKAFGPGCDAGENLRRSFYYAWVDNPPVEGFPDLITALKEWRYDAEVEGSGDLSVMYFHGEKLGDDEFLWRRLAPVIVEGSAITCKGEDDEQWRWKFDGYGMQTVQSRTVWDDEETEFTQAEIPVPPSAESAAWSANNEAIKTKLKLGKSVPAFSQPTQSVVAEAFEYPRTRKFILDG